MPDDIQTYRIRYTGPAALAILVAQALQNEGLVVSWTPPEEQHGVSEAVAASIYIVGATDSRMRAAVDEVRERLGERGTIAIEDDDGTESND
jgi:hypothetical protein